MYPINAKCDAKLNSEVSSSTPLPEQNSSSTAELATQYSLTAMLWVTQELYIAWVNPAAEQLFLVSEARLLGQSVLPLLHFEQSQPQQSPAPPQTVPVFHEPPAGDHNAVISASPHKISSMSTTPTFVTASESLGSGSLWRTDLSSKNDSATAPHQASLSQKFTEAWQYQQIFSCHDQLIRGVGKPVWVDYSVTPTDTASQQGFLIELWQKDRHDRLAQELQQQLQFDTARDMLKAVAHEVKNPLAGIRGAAQLLGRQLQQHGLQDARITTYQELILNEVDRLSALIAELLGQPRLPEWQTSNIHNVLERVLAVFEAQQVHAQPPIRVIRDYDLSLPELQADTDMLIQVFLNLLNNAQHALQVRVRQAEEAQAEQQPYQPTVTLSTRVQSQHTIGQVRHRQVLKVSVRDNGCGIPAGLLPRIFFPLVTGRAEGTGLGLALVQQMLQQHQGSIEVQSQFGDTQFCVYLPFSPSLP